MLISPFLFDITAPPEITVEKSWVHASEGSNIELACIVHGDVTSDVSTQQIYVILHSNIVYILYKDIDFCCFTYYMYFAQLIIIMIVI